MSSTVIKSISSLFSIGRGAMFERLGITVLMAALALICQTFPVVNADIDLNTKTGSKICVGKICDDSSAFHYYECCGQLFNDCCLRLQTWVIIVLAIIGICMLASFILGLIRCICRCGD